MHMTQSDDDVYHYAIRLLARRDLTALQVRDKLSAKFGAISERVIEELISENFLNDQRFAENYIARRPNRGPLRLRQELIARGITPNLADVVLQNAPLPSLQDAVKAKMLVWHLRAPLQRRDAARLFRALVRLGYEEEAVRGEIEQLHE
jgi:regulatory protein